MAYKRILIKNTHIIDTANFRCDNVDILLNFDAGRIHTEKIARKITAEDVRVVEASSLYAAPAFVDLWSHIGESGGESRETISTGTNAAICGGFGYILVAPDGEYVLDSPSAIERRAHGAFASSKCRVGFCGALTKGMKGKELCDYKSLLKSGAVAFSDGKKEAVSDDLLYEAMSLLSKENALFIGHPRYHSEYMNSAANLGRVSGILGVKGIPSSAEALDVARYILYAAETGCRLHLCEISCEASLELISQAKSKDFAVSASTSPQYFSFCENDLLFYGARAKVYPPLRTSRDVNAVISALADGTLDCISSDHTPLAKKEKGNNLKTALDGSIGLQTAFSAADSYLLEPGKVDLYRLIDLMSRAPANILGLDFSIRENTDTFLNLLSLDREFIVTENYLKSRSSNSIFLGLNLRGCVEKAFVSNPSEKNI